MVHSGHDHGHLDARLLQSLRHAPCSLPAPGVAGISGAFRIFGVVGIAGAFRIPGTLRGSPRALQRRAPRGHRRHQCLVAPADRGFIELLAEIEERGLHLEAACSSVFAYCCRRLGLSESEAFLRMTAARLGRRFPAVFELVASGHIHLSALALLRDHLTADNHAEVLGAASHKTKRQIEELVAARFPRPDVPDRIRKLPDARSRQADGGRPAEQALLPAAAPARLFAANAPEGVHGASTSERAPEGVHGASAPEPEPVRRTDARQTAAPPASTLTPDMAPRATTARPPARGRIEPLSAARYRIELTAGVALRDKLVRARDLMRHQNPSGDLAFVVERALDLLVGELENKRLAKTSRPRPPRPAANANARSEVAANANANAKPAVKANVNATATAQSKPNASHARRVKAAARREVFERDGERCSFAAADGQRCDERGWLELDHVWPRGRGGASEATNLRVCCRAHNLHAAERVFGRAHVRQRIRLRQTKCPPSGPAQ